MRHPGGDKGKQKVGGSNRWDGTWVLRREGGGSALFEGKKNFTGNKKKLGAFFGKNGGEKKVWARRAGFEWWVFFGQGRGGLLEASCKGERNKWGTKKAEKKELFAGSKKGGDCDRGNEKSPAESLLGREWVKESARGESSRGVHKRKRGVERY